MGDSNKFPLNEKDQIQINHYHFMGQQRNANEIIAYSYSQHLSFTFQVLL